MPCESMKKPGQTLQQRAAEVRAMVERLSAALASGRARAVVGPRGQVAFTGLSDRERDGVTDACAYRRLMVSGGALARAAVARAEQLAGRSIDRKTVAQGTHSHDGGHTWHGHD